MLIPAKTVFHPRIAFLSLFIEGYIQVQRPDKRAIDSRTFVFKDKSGEFWQSKAVKNDIMVIKWIVIFKMKSESNICVLTIMFMKIFLVRNIRSESYRNVF